MNRSSMKRLIAYAILTLPMAAAAQDPNLRVSDAWIRAAPPNAMVLAGYLTMENDGDNEVAVVAVHSASFASIEMHQTVIENELARMVEQSRFVVPPHGRLELRPRGRHLMLMMPKTGLQPGDTVELELELTDGQRVPFTAIVRSPDSTGTP